MKWDATTNATGYKILKSTSSGSGFTQIGTTTENSATTYVATGLIPGQRYYFKVQGTVNTTTGALSEEKTAIANVDDQGNVFAGDNILISNQSTDIASTQSTGTLSINEGVANMDVMESEDLDPEAYRINPVIPFEPVEGQEPVSNSVDGEIQVQATYTVGNTRSFIVDKESTSNPATITGRCAYDGTHVQVWVDNAADAKIKLTDAQAAPIGKEFDSKIYSLVTNNFYTAPNVDGDGKIAILCFDIADTYSGPNTAYKAGFFYGGDLYQNSQLNPQNQNSNEMEIFYADTYPTMIKNPDNPVYNDPDVTQVYSTLAHEFQHMVNFNRNHLVETDGKDMDIWLNEALSMAAEDMYNGTQTNRISYYNSSAAIQNGHSLLSWQSGSDVLANYSLSYLFSQYLRTQIDQVKGSGQGVLSYKSIIEDPAENYVAVENVIKKIDSTLTFGQFMTNFRAAMLVKAPKGPYGFNGESGFNLITTPTYSGTGTTLKGGGAIVKSIDPSFTKPADSGTVSFLGIYN